MQNRAFSLICTVFLLAVVLLQLRDANAKSLVKFQDSFNLTTNPTNGQAVQQTTTTPSTSKSRVIKPTTNVQPSENTFTKYASTQGSEELILPTVVVMPTTEEPLCRKKAKEIEELLEMYTMLGIHLQDISPPECDSEGYYKPLQCQFNGCHCVDRYGTPTSEFRPNGFGFTCPQTGAVFADESSQ